MSEAEDSDSATDARRRPRKDFSSTGELTKNAAGGSGMSVQEKLRLRRLGSSSNVPTDVGSSAPSTPGVGSSGGVARAVSSSASDMRKRLLARRQTERGITSGDDEENENEGGGRGGPRSPARRNKTISSGKFGASLSGKTEKVPEVDEDGDSGSDAGSTAEKEEELLDDEFELCKVQDAEGWFPLQVLPQGRAEALAMHPILALPVARPASFDPRKLVESRGMEEADILFGHRGSVSGNGTDDAEPLLGADGMIAEDDASALPTNSASVVADGLYVQDGPSLAKLLLTNAEEVPESLVKGTASRMDPALKLARVTQRTLRDMFAEAERREVHQKYLAMKAGTDLDAKGSARGKENKAGGANEMPTLPQGKLLKQTSTGTVTQVLENPLDERASTVVLPETSRSVGGILGNWGPDATIKERLGPLSVGHDKRIGSRSILRLHVHKLAFSEHPLMNEEERTFASLKSTFAVYRSLIEQRTVVFLSDRLQVIVRELQRCLRHQKKRGEEEADPEDVLLLKALYANLCETLPLLTELRASLDSLTVSIMDQWRGIKEIRQRTGITSTRARMTVGPLQGSGGGDIGAKAQRKGRRGEDDREDKDVHEEAEQGTDGWAGLAECLNAIPLLLPDVHSFLFKAEAALLDEKDREAADAAAAIEAALRKPTKSPRAGAVSAVGGAADKLSASQSLTMGTAILSPRSQSTKLGSDFKRHGLLLNTAVVDLLKCRCLLPEYVLRVDSDGGLTPPSQLDSAEQARRARLESTQFKAVVRVNGKRVTETKLYPMQLPQLTVDLSQFFEFRVLRQLESLTVDIVSSSSSCLSSEVFVASVGVPFPGQLEVNPAGGVGSHLKQTGAHLYAPVIGWLSFSSEEGALNRNGSVISRETDSLPADAQVRGSVLVACEYAVASADYKPLESASKFDGIEESALAVLPPQGEKDRATAWGSGYTLGGGLSSQRLLPALQSMDPNDPRNDILATRVLTDPLNNDKKVFHLFGHDFSVSFTESGESYANYLRFKEGPRAQMLKLRQHSPQLFTEPIPLTDDEIRESETYRRILAQNTRISPLLDLEAESRPPDAASTSGARSKLKSFLQRVRNSSTAQGRHVQHKKITTQAAVAETQYYYPFLEIDLENLLPERKRSLKPKPAARSATAMHVNRASMLVQVVAARNIPLRSETDTDYAPAGVPSNSMRSRSPKKSGSRRGGFDQDGYGSGSGASDSEQPQVSEVLLDETKVLLRKRARTCVEVRFQEHRQCTSTIAGGAPIWKQSFSLPFRSPNDDYTPSALQQIRDIVTFNLFDEIEEDDAKRGIALEGDSTTRTERRFLGSFSLPFNAVYSMGRVEGIFRLNTPLLNFGYAPAGPIAAPITGAQVFEVDAPEDAHVHKPTFFEMMVQTCFKLPQRTPPSEYGHFIHNATANDLDHYACGNGSTYIKIMVTLDPLLSTLPEIPMDLSASNLYSQDRPFGPYASVWTKELGRYSQHTKERRYKIFGENADGQQTLICRYLSPQSPPEGFRSTRAAIHLVSQLPYMADVHSFEHAVDFWCTTKQFWEVGAGDMEEHAVQLFNYLYYFSLMGEADSTNAVMRRGDRRPRGDATQGAYPPDEVIRNESVFLIIGRGIPDGDACYVLVRDHNVKSDSASSKGYLVIDACTGHVYSAMDPVCPLREIYCLATPYNIWANIQYTDKVYESSFDVLDSAMWRPFFGSRMPPPTGGLHTIQDDVAYVPTSAGYALEVETSVLGAIKNSLRRWRSKRHRNTTTFHPDGCLIMQDLLPKLEQFKRRGNTPEADVDKFMAEAEKKMAPILRTRTFRGSPVNLPFTDVEDVMNMVKSIGVHESKHPEVQFVLAVKAVPLVNETVSLWIFLGTLESHAGMRS